MPDHQSPKTDAFLDALRELTRVFYATQPVPHVQKFAESHHVGPRRWTKVVELGRGCPTHRTDEVLDGWGMKVGASTNRASIAIAVEDVVNVQR
jgi:hypothetical protein